MEMLRRLFARLESGPLAPLVQFIKFSLVGVSNTAISYGVDNLCYYLLFQGMERLGPLSLLGRTVTGENLRVFASSVVAFLISVINAYYWNSRFVFAAGEKRSLRQHIGPFFRTMACYAVTGLLMAPAMKMWLGARGIPFWAASLATLIITIPLNFLLNKFWAFRKKDGGEQQDS